MSKNRIIWRGKAGRKTAAALTTVLRDTKAMNPIPREKLVCVLPFCGRETQQVLALLNWIGVLGGCQAFGCVLLPDARFPVSPLPGILRLASQVFGRVEMVTPDRSLPNEKWPHGPNLMFEAALRYAAEHLRGPWLWNEPDSIPLRTGWMEALEAEYRQAGKPFMGCVFESTPENPCPRHLSGCAIYPQDASKYCVPAQWGDDPWDVASRRRVLPLAHHSPLFQLEWGTVGHPPTFTNPSDLARLRQDAVLYHRNKDGSLLRWLRWQLTQNLTFTA